MENNIKAKPAVLCKTGIKLCLVLLLFSGLHFWTAPDSYAGKIRVVEGLIENINNDSIEVRGRHYDISDISVIDTDGKKVLKNQLKTGSKVEIFFEDNRIKNILLYPDNIVE